MSTAELYLEQDEVEEFIAETRNHVLEHEMYSYGEEGKEYGVSPYITFYIYHTEEDFPRLSEAIIELYQELQTLMDEQFRKVYDNKSENWKDATPKNLGREILQEYAKTCYRADVSDQLDGSVYYGNKSFYIEATTEESSSASARWAIGACIESANYMRYSAVKITFRDKWYRQEDKTKRIQNKKIWHDFVEKWIARLQPEHCYSGYEIGTTTTGVMGAYESDVMERICADYFYGLDVDHPGDMGFHKNDWELDYKNAVIEYGKDKVDKEAIKRPNPARLGAGLRTPTWCFLLSPLWRNKLGKSVDEVKKALAHPDITVTEIPYPVNEKHNPNGEPALWIQLGELNLYPVDEGVPELPCIANALIKPIRANLLQLYTLDPWEDDPNPRFDFENSPKWIARFDSDSEFPDSERRFYQPTPDPTQNRCMGGEPCPKAGKWWTPANESAAREFKQGEIMPKFNSSYGATIWYREE